MDEWAGGAPGYAERQPVVLLLDTSASMGRPEGSPRIDELNDALDRWFAEEQAAPRLGTEVEVCLLAFDSRVRVLDPVTGELVPPEQAPPERLFVPVERMRPPRLTASGLTRMTEALRAAVDLAGRHYRTLQDRRVPVRRPYLWLLTDGAPSDAAGARMTTADLAPTARAVREGEEHGAFVLQVVGVRGADLDLLRVLAPKAALQLGDTTFRQILDLVFHSSARITPDRPADDVHRQTAAFLARQERARRLEEQHR